MLTSELLIFILITLLVITLVLAVIQLRAIKYLQKSGNNNDVTFNENPSAKEDAIDVVNDQALAFELEELKAQLKSKTIELAKVAKENEEKNQILNEVKQKVAHCANNPSSLPRITRDVLAMLDSAIITHDSTFEIQIDELHQEFSKKMKHKYPDLTAHDLRLATYIKIGLNSKEISELLNIKPSSVYISRSRLRKKIDMDTDTDLHGYLNSI